MTTNGIDISSWNAVTDWSLVSKDILGLKFCYIKATEGTGYRDDITAKWQGAASAGLLRACYHFHRAAAGGAAQATYFMNWAQKGELPPMVDFEDVDGYKVYGGKVVFENLRACLIELSQRWSITPVVYTGLWYLQLLWATAPTYDSKWLANYPLWIAHYTGSPAVEPYRPSWWPWTFYQYTSNGTVGGIYGRVDLDVYKGTLDELRAWAGLPPLTQPGLGDAEKVAKLWAAHPELH